MRGILLRSRCHPHFAVYDIKKFFRSVLTSTKDSFLRIMCVPSEFFSSAPTLNPTWRYFRDQAIPFGDSASGDYATCAKVATVKTFITDSPPHLQPAILRAGLEDTYIDDGGVGANSPSELSTLQQEIERILNRGGFFIKSWEKSGKDGTSNYLGMMWGRLRDLYSLKFCLNLHKKFRGIPSDVDLDSDFLQNESIPITKKNVLSIACQFYDPTGLAAPLMFSVRALFSEICHDPLCSINSILSEECTAKFRDAVREILLTREIFFPRHVIFRYQAQLFIFSMAPCRAMELVCMLTLAISLISFPSPQKYWENLHSLLHNLKWPEPYSPPGWSKRSIRNCSTSPSPLLRSLETQRSS